MSTIEEPAIETDGNVGPTERAVLGSFELRTVEGHFMSYRAFAFGDGYELCLEPRVVAGQFEVALYQHGELIVDKVPVARIERS